MLGNHLLGLYEKALDPRDTWEKRLHKAKKLGFDFVEISIDESPERYGRLFWSREQRRQLLETSFDLEVPIQSMCLSVHRRFPFGSADAQIRSQAHELMKRAIDFAADLGIRVIQLAGYDVYYEPSTPESVAYFQQGMEWAAEQAGRAQVMLAMEIMDTPFMNSITKFQRYEQQIKSPWFKVYPDLGNLTAWPENDPEEELNRGIGSIVAVHLKDTLSVTKDFPGQFKNLPFGKGCVDFQARFSQLERLGYTGPYMMEMWYQSGTDDLAQVAQARDFVVAQYAAALEYNAKGAEQ